jgi:peptidoglycan/LPS O-acetylase OafA/YrhL
MKYRTEIDGLRALAVLPVIFFHAGFEWFSGGFVGVDVFFVISGYLITTIIISEMAEGKFSIVNFYERRARRILPALFFVMAVCLPFAWLGLAPNDLKDFGQSLVAVSTFSSNILFWLESGYFDTAAELKPLLHTWSLAIEEQYYILFPIFLILTWRFGIKWILLLLSIFFLMSLGAATWATQYASDPKITSGAFFLLPTRGWELLVGAFSAFYLKYNTHLKSHLINQALSLFGFGMIFYSILVFDENTPFPSLYALLPTIGTGLLILCAVPKTLVHRLLSLRFIVGIGLISYSAYLWHQPVLVFARHAFFNVELGAFALIVLICLSLALGWFSWYFIEAPFRNRKVWGRQEVFSMSALLVSTFFTVGLILHFNSGFSDRGPPELRDENLKRVASSCNFEFRKSSSSSIASECHSGSTVYLVGDSHAKALGFSLSEKLSELGLKVTTLSHDGCLPIKGVSRRNVPQTCLDFIQYLYDEIFIDGNNVVFAARWRLNIEGTRYNNGEGGVELGRSGQVFLKGSVNNEIKEQANKEGLLDFIQFQLSDIAVKTNLIVINQIPEVGLHVPTWYWRSSSQLTHSYLQYKRQNKSINQMLHEVGSLKLINTEKLVCSELSERCVTRLGSDILYFDDNHPSIHFSELIAGEVSESIIYLEPSNTTKYHE